jgi:hypothetical protein
MEYAASRNIPRVVSEAVIRRDGLACRLCSRAVVRTREIRDDQLHLDHVIHWAAGGGHTVENLRVTCRRCNLTRAKPREVVRTATMPAWRDPECGTWHWNDATLMPTKRPNSAGMQPVERVATEYDVSPAIILAAILRDELAAHWTPGGPIRVAYPPRPPRSRRLSTAQLVARASARLAARDAAPRDGARP